MPAKMRTTENRGASCAYSYRAAQRRASIIILVIREVHIWQAPPLPSRSREAPGATFLLSISKYGVKVRKCVPVVDFNGAIFN